MTTMKMRPMMRLALRSEDVGSVFLMCVGGERKGKGREKVPVGHLGERFVRVVELEGGSKVRDEMDGG